MKNDVFLQSLVIAILVPFLFSTLAFGIEDVNQYTVKSVYEFEIQRNINALKNDMTNDLIPELEDRLNQFGTHFENFSYTIEDPNTGVLDWGINPDSGLNWYQIYPKISISGSNQTMTQTEFNQEYNTLISLVRIEVLSFLENNNAVNVNSHMHYTFGIIGFSSVPMYILCATWCFNSSFSMFVCW